MKLPKLPHQGSRSRELDFIRGIAILLVMGVHFFSVDNHFWLYQAFEFPGRRFGGSGVDLFFVLSGFLVGGLLMKEYKKTGGLVASAFIFRRGFKIWPSYYFFILVEVVMHVHPLKTFLWQNLFHLQNYVGSTISHTWTLSLEEHFYLLLAFAMGWMVKQKWSPERMLRTFLATMGVVLLIRTLTVVMGWPGAMEFTHNRIDSLLAGVCLAVLFHFFPERFEKLSSRPLPLAAISIAVVAFMVFVTNQPVRDSIGFTIIYVGAAAFLLLVFTHSGKIKEWAIYKGISAVGVYSYGIYLWHNSIRHPAETIAHKMPHALQWPAIMILQYGLAILVGVILTQVVEWPFLRLRNKLIPQKVLDISGPESGVDADSPESEVETPKSKSRAPKLLAIFFLAALAVLGLSEVAARKLFGLGNPPLYQPDPGASYVLKPNQDLKRFGSRIHINKWGMRSEDVADVPPAGVLRVLFLGDSVTNGGAQTDQAKTFPYLVASKLSNTESLNPSCGGWVPANELAWLQENGVHGSQLVVLVINDDDLFQSKAPDISGLNPNYPREKPASAIGEFLVRYLKPRVIHEDSNDPGTGQDPMTSEVANASRQAVHDEIQLAKKDGAKVMVLLTHLDPKDKVKPEIPPMREALQKMVEGEGVPFVVADLKDHSEYYGGPHPNPKGNEAIAEQLATIIAKVVGRS